MALSAARTLDEHVDQKIRTVRMKASTTIHKGALVGLSSGYARGLVAQDKFAGLAMESKVNAGADGAETIRIQTTGDYVHPLTGAAQANVASAVYASDDSTASFTASGNSFLGFCVDVPKSNTIILRIKPFNTAP